MLNASSLFNKFKFAAFICSALNFGAPSIAQELEPGIVDPFQSQLPVTLWREDDLASSVALLRDAEPATISTINRLRIVIALSQSRPALSKDASDAINAARLNMLFSDGVLDAAEALAQTMAWQAPIVRTEVEKIALLTTRPERYCARLLAKQFIEIEQGMLIYCMVRSNKWQEAIDVFHGTKDNIEPTRATTLQRFLELDGENNPILDEPWKTIPQPLDFILDEAFGRPRGEAPLPPSYVYYARDVGSSPSVELEFTEELTRYGSVPANVLFATYRNFNASGTGPIFERVQIAQDFSKLDVTNLHEGFDQWLSNAIVMFADVGLLQPLASQIAPSMAKIDLSTVKNNSTRNKIVRLAILGGWSKKGWSRYVARDDFTLAMAFALRHPDVKFTDLLNQKLPTMQSRAVYQAFIEEEQPKLEFEKSAGIELLESLNILDDFITHPEADVVRAFQVLRQTGQDQFARDIAVVLLFGGATP